MSTEIEKENLQPVEEQNDLEKPVRNKTKEILSEIFEWIRVIVLAFVIAIVLNSFVILNSNVPTGSMENTIMPGNRLIGLRLAYKMSEPKRGDVIMFKYPLDESQIFIKRLIGLPGEHLEIHQGKVYINHNSEPLEETYLKEKWVEANDGIVYDIPEDCYFMMGDNRNNSLDGRYWAEYAVAEGLAEHPNDAVKKKLCFVTRDQILGKALFRYYPTPKNMAINPYE